MSGVLQLLFDTHGCPNTSTDVTSLLYRGEEGTGGVGPGGGGISGQAVRFTKMTNARWTCTFSLIDSSGTGANRPVCGQAFRLLEDGAVRFRGFIDQIDEGNPEGTTVLLYDCTCSSWASLLDRRTVRKVYQMNEPAASVIADIIATLGEAITTNNVIVSGLLTTPVGATKGPIAASTVFDTIGDMTDCEWWIDESDDLHFVPVNAGSSLGWSVTLTNGEYQAGSIKITRTTKDKRNDQIVTSTSLGQPPATTASSSPSTSPANQYTTLTDTYITKGPLDFFVITSQPIQLDPANPVKPTVKVNGVAQTVKQYFVDAQGQNAWYFGVNSIGVQKMGPQTAPAPGSTVEITYQAFAGAGGTVAVSAGGGSNTPGVVPAQDWVEVSNPTDIAAMALIDGSTGKWELVTDVTGISDPSVAGQLAQGLLDRSVNIPDVIQFDTWRGNYAIGSKLTVNLTPLHNINGTYTVIQIDAQEQPATKGPITGQTFLYTITLSNQQNVGDYIKWMQDLFRSISSSSGSSGNSGVQNTTTASQPGLQIIREIPSGTINGSNVSFTLTFTPEPPWALWLFVNGVLQHADATEPGGSPDYTLSGNTITFAVAPVSRGCPQTTDMLEALYFISNPGLAPVPVQPTVYSTGAFQNDGAREQHWVLDTSPDVTNPGPVAFVANHPYPAGFVTGSPGANWISPNASFGGSAGMYKYKLYFQWPSTTGTLKGRISGDDTYTLKLNGVTIQSGPPNMFGQSIDNFTITSGFIAGMNTLEIDAPEDGTGAAGILVIIDQATSP